MLKVRGYTIFLPCNSRSKSPSRNDRIKKKRAAEINNATALVPILEGAVFGNLRIEMYNSLFCFDLELSAR